ncbi:exo-rhamnogalacturonan lyase family protein [Roseateles sp. P5_E7]
MKLSPFSRRGFLQSTAVASLASSLPAAQAATANLPTTTAPVSDTVLRWLDGVPPSRFEGATFGVPWPRGQVRSGAKSLDFKLGNHAMQSWPLAYWPDGSLKWTAHAIAGGSPQGPLKLEGGTPAAGGLTVKQTATQIVISAGDLAWTVPTRGEALIAEASRAGRVTLKNLRLIALRQDGAEPELDGKTARQSFSSKVTTVTVEQQGPVRAVLKLDGTHTGNGRDWLRFSVRLYFYAGAESVRIVHTFVWDGEPAKDFIAGLGVTAQVPMSNATHDRHVRFSGEGIGVWGEAVRPVTGLRRDPGKPYKDAQVAGLALPALSGMAKAVQDGLKWIPEWNDFSLSQANADGFTLRKRTQGGQAWIDSNGGSRSKGLVYAGGASGGVALGLKDFWQRAPVRLDVRGAATDLADVTAWLYSPSAPAMDMRSYRAVGDMNTHEKEIEGLNITYEDYEAGWDNSVGVARTSELQLWVLGATPSHQVFSDMAEQVANPARPVLTPQRIHAAGVFGDWDPVEAGTPARKLIEDRLALQLNQYLKEVEQHRWYGFWNYGDVMHTYDVDRHMWRYDIGGYAWDNSELSTDLWLWMSYLRTGRADIFRLAEAMTRHTGEVDVYHLGEFKGFGTRHGVQHWSDSSKQPRVSNAAYRRIYFYLTADERCGDLIRELLDSDADIAKVDISRKLNRAAAPAETADLPGVGFGTTWGSWIAAWLTEWERTGDARWRTKLVNGMQTIGDMKRRWFAGGAPYDAKTGKFMGPGENVSISHLNGVFGVIEISSELLTLVDVPAYRKAWLEYCRYYNAPKNEIAALLGKDPGGRSLTDTCSRMTAYAAFQEKDRALALRAWREFFASRALKGGGGVKRIGGVDVIRPLDEMSSISTNDSAQWGLAGIQNLALIGDSLDEAAKAAGLVQ